MMNRILFYIIIGMGLLTSCSSESSDNGLIIYDFRVVDRDAGDLPVTESEMDDLRAYGINNMVEEQFQIRQLTSDDMHLESALESLHFRKY